LKRSCKLKKTKVSFIVCSVVLSTVLIQNASQLRMIISQTPLLPETSQQTWLFWALVTAKHYNSQELMKRKWWC